MLEAVLEASGMDEAANDVAGETADTQSDVDRFGGAAGAQG